LLAGVKVLLLWSSFDPTVYGYEAL